MTDFTARLIAVIEELGQSEVARRMGCSAATISLLKTGRYPGATVERWQREFDAVFARGMINCPVLGEITAEQCAFHRKRPFAATNPIRVQLYRTCPTCPNNPLSEDNDG